MTEAFVEWDGHKTWYRVVGDLGGKPPLVMLHGGPGAPHDYLESLAELAGDGRACVFYDQIGCGRSDRLPDAASDFWNPDLFKRELVELTNALGIAARYHVYGQSWGGMLAMEHALTHPKGLASIVVADSPASIPLWLAETAKLRAALPADVQATLDRHEAAGTTEDPEYIEACMAFYTRHLCRIPFPDALMRSFAALMEDNTVYSAMWGPSEFTCTGSLRDWDITGRLGEIDVPTLVVSGRYDEATPAVVEPVHRGIAGSEWIIFEESSHSPHVEEQDAVLAAVRTFLDRVER